MGPRKKSKPNPEAENGQTPGENAAASASSQVVGSAAPSADELQGANVPVAPSLQHVGASQISQSSPQLVSGRPNELAVQKQVENRASWYGSWKGKAKPVAEVARDNIPASPAAMSSTTSLPQSPLPSQNQRRSSIPPAPSPRRYMSASARPTSKGDILPASTSNLSVGSERTKNVTEQQPAAAEEVPKEGDPEPPLPPDPVQAGKQGKEEVTVKQQQNNANATWFGWWSRPDGYVEKPVVDVKKELADKTAEDARQKPLPDSPIEERTQPKLDQTEITRAPPASTPADQEDHDQKQGASNSGGSQRNSWFWSWSRQQNAKDNDRPSTSDGVTQPSEPAQVIPVDTQKVSSGSEPSVTKVNEPLAQKPDSGAEMKSLQSRKSTGWAFWSREPDGNSADKSHKQVGEIAVEGTPSQSKPEAAQFNEADEQEPTPKETAKGNAKNIREKRPVKDSPKQASTPSKGTPSRSPERKPEEPKVAALAGKRLIEQPKQAKDTSKDDKNLLLPDFNSTYSLLQQPSIWAQIRRLFITDSNNFPGPHLHLTPNPPRIKKALAVGVHGFFPSPIYQKILGQPTGTSIRFSNCAAQAIKSWTESRGYDCEIEKIALEGEGFISERVDTLWKLLLNWIEHIRQADFILVACHSQGVPVAVTLVAKLIAFGCVSNARIGICAMAGISMGPFAEYKTRMFGGSALELFDFTEPKSKVSEAYRGAVEEVLNAGVRIVYVGSIDDQLVSLESSTFAPLSHPNIYRAVFIDGRLHTSDFLTQLIGFALKLRNLGLPDHGLIRELSPALAGSLYSGDGHSVLHNYMPIYELAVRHALETTPADPVTAAEKARWGTLQGPTSIKDANPYFLPWAMRGILEERAVRDTMGEEVEHLLRLFEEWKPQSKGLKDIKFRLEAVRSKL